MASTAKQSVGRDELLAMRRRRRHPRLPANEVARRAGVDAGALQRDLEHRVEGEVHFDEAMRAAYSTDSSNFRLPPICVVIPRTREATVEALKVCHDHQAPVVVRGTGTALEGSSTNEAVIIDISKFLRHMLEVNPEGRYAWVEPGVVRDQLTQHTESQHNLTMMVDTSTHEYASFGGMIGLNSCGVHSVVGGRMSDNVEGLEVALYDGTVLEVGNGEEDQLDTIIAGGGPKGEIYARLRDLRDRYADVIREEIPSYQELPRMVSGYRLEELLPENGFNVAKSLVGSESTCVAFLRCKVRLMESPPERSIVVLGFDNIYHAADHIPMIMDHEPFGCEAIDGILIDDMIKAGTELSNIPQLPDGNGWLIVEFAGWTKEEAVQKAHAFRSDLEGDPDIQEVKEADSLDDLEAIWEMRESGLGASAYVPQERQHWPGWEDAAVPPQHLGQYLREWQELLDKYNLRAPKYGHFGQGLVHSRIDFDLNSAGGVKAYRRFLEESNRLVKKFGGVATGEHGDGQQRGELMYQRFSAELMQAMEEYKAIWDPQWKMNPGKMVRPRRMDEDLKLGPDYTPPVVKTEFAYPEDGGSFAHATLRCVGAGVCRDTWDGTMCPSYMATLDEKHTTRGRARILFEMLQGQVIKDGFRSKEVFEALDLCLSCKGCTGDCPVNVDMPTYKAEFLHKYYKGRLRPMYAYSMGYIMAAARVANRVPRLANFATHAPVIGKLVKRMGGIAPNRQMPEFAPQSLVQWFRERGGTKNTTGPKVVVWPDTFNNYLHVEVGKAMVECLEAAGRRVVIPEQPVCCGRPLYDYGQLGVARKLLKRNLNALREHIRDGTFVVGIEPSCLAVFRDELVNMLPHDMDAKRLSLQTLTFGEYMQRHASDYDPPKLKRKAKLHVHCHQEGTAGSRDDMEFLQRMGLEVEKMDTGCCGLAGSFGFEKDKFELSKSIANHKFIPMMAGSSPDDLLLISDGFSCKHQLEELTERRMLHTAQVMKMALEHGIDGVTGPRPERAYPDVKA